jgi:hypothetical protein
MFFVGVLRKGGAWTWLSGLRLSGLRLSGLRLSALSEGSRVER